jgi:hypothetical protein
MQFEPFLGGNGCGWFFAGSGMLWRLKYERAGVVDPPEWGVTKTNGLARRGKYMPETHPGVQQWGLEFRTI